MNPSLPSILRRRKPPKKEKSSIRIAKRSFAEDGTGGNVIKQK